jgi:hypothetical protein
MNIDFHYYATYLAARIAEYTKEEAQIIAYAAQYVDESTEDMVDMELLPDLKKSTPTTESILTLVKRNADLLYEDREIQESEKIWTCFHFLPGNIHPNDPLKEYRGSKNYGKTVYGDKEKRAFSLMCQPNSVLCEKMINNISQYNQEPYFLELLGICMHILADTWSHCYFAGTPSWWINEGPKEVYDSSGDIIKFSIIPSYDETSTVNELFSDNYLFATPPMLDFRSFTYLGHGRMGGIPDVPFMRYRYQPQWNDKEVFKDNPSDFMLAFRQMVYAMICAKTNSSFKSNKYARLNDNLEDTLKEVFGKQDYEASKAAKTWNPVIRQLYPDDDDLPDFNKDLWKSKAVEVKGQSTAKTTCYYYFNYAAVLHQNFVLEYVEELRLYNAQERKRGKIDETDYVMLFKKDNEEKWKYAATHIDFLNLDGICYSAQYIKGHFWLYEEGKKERGYTCNYLDYIGWNNEKNRVQIKDGEFILQNLEDGEAQTVSEIQYIDWNGGKRTASLANWEDTDYEYLNGDFRKMNMKLFLLKKQEEKIPTISPRIPFFSIQKENKKAYIFEYIFWEDMQPQEVFRVNTQKPGGENMLMSSLRVLADGENNNLLEIKENKFWVNNQEKDSINLMGRDDSQIEISMIDWKDF